MIKDNASIKTIVHDDRLFNALTGVANEMILNWERQSCVRSTCDETALLTAAKEAKIEAVRSLLRELEELASK